MSPSGVPTLSQGRLRGLVGFEFKGGRDAGRKLIDSLKMFYHVANIGDAVESMSNSSVVGRKIAPVTDYATRYTA
jgi:O-acetylhomoserine (thiol)-lyase